MIRSQEIIKHYPAKYLLIAGISATGIFIVDALLPLGIADGMLYVALVLLGMMSRNRKLIIIAAIVSSILNLLGYFFSPPGGEFINVITNRILAFCIRVVWEQNSLMVTRQPNLRLLFYIFPLCL